MAKRAKKKTDPAKEGVPVVPYGRMYPSVEDGGPMWLREDVGKATAKDGVEYELAINVAGGHHIVASKKTGKRFVLTWEDIIFMARVGGIDE